MFSLYFINKITRYVIFQPRGSVSPFDINSCSVRWNQMGNEEKTAAVIKKLRG